MGCKNCKKSDGVKQGILYGLVPHLGCIGFIVFSVLGVAGGAAVFRPLLLKPYFFHLMVAMSFVFASISAVAYLRNNDSLSLSGIKKRGNYLLTLYGTTMMINILLVTVVFPYAANIAPAVNATPSPNTREPTEITTLAAPSTATALTTLSIAVDIPCTGHAPLISDELRKLRGVSSVGFSPPNVFEIKYTTEQISRNEILALDIFREYPATSQSTQEVAAATPQDSQNVTAENNSTQQACCSGGCSGCSKCGEQGLNNWFG